MQKENSAPLIKKALNSSVPIWLLRQAGRYMDEYMQIRKTEDDFLSLCYNPKKVAEITMQPISRFNLDAAIIFSDILVLPDALGWKVKFCKGEGPVLEKFLEESDLSKFSYNLDKKIENVYEAIAKTRSILNKDKTLIGFCGSPWTVMSYILEGKGKQDFSYSKNFIYSKNEVAKKLCSLLVKNTIEHLINQIKAGADTIMLFDSWSGVLGEIEYEEFVITPTKQIVEAIKKIFPSVPVIGFPRGSGYLYDRYINESGADIISVDQFVPLDIMRKWQDKIVVQGNLDPVVLLSGKDKIKEKVDEIFKRLQKKNFIFNVGHGILQTTPPENVDFLVDYVKNKKNSGSFI